MRKINKNKARILLTCIFLPTIIILGCQAHSETGDEFLEGFDFDVALTAVRLKQSLADTPASVTIINHEMIKASGFRRIDEVFALVPGFVVRLREGNRKLVTYHSGNLNTPRRLQVLLDGVPIYGSELARINWSAFPIALEEIDRIEFVRSPSSASYGSNAFNAVINIISKHPADQSGLEVQIKAGSLTTKDTRLSYHNTLGQSSYRIAFSSQSDSGVDTTGKTFANENAHDGHENLRFNGSLHSQLSDQTDIELWTTVTRGHFEREFAFTRERQREFPDFDIDEHIISAKIQSQITENNLVSLQVYEFKNKVSQPLSICFAAAAFSPEVAALFRINPALAESVIDGEPVIPQSQEELNALTNVLRTLPFLINPEGESILHCGNTNQNIEQQRRAFEIQSITSISDQLRIVSAIGYSQSMVESETFFRQPRYNNSRYLLSNIEFRPNNAMTINAGGILEEETHLKRKFSPRLGVNFHLNTKNTLRFTHSKAIRSPDLGEVAVDARYTFTELEPPYRNETTVTTPLNLESPNTLKPERIVANEIGYHLNLPYPKLQYDLKIFKEEMSNLISEGLVLFELNTLSNSNSAEIRGLEHELTYQGLRDKLFLRLNYTRYDSHSDNGDERTLSAKKTFLAMATYYVTNNVSGTIIYDGLLNNDPEFYFRHTDAVINWNLKLSKSSSLESQFRVRHYADDSANFYDDDTHYFMGIQLNIDFE